MKQFANKQVIGHFHVIAFIFTLVGIIIVGKAAYTMFVKRSYWQAVSDRFVRDNVVVHPRRGNIFSADGQLLATSLPEYKIYMDFVAVDKDSAEQVRLQSARDSLLQLKLDSLCHGLARVLPDKPVSWYRHRILEGQRRRSRNWLLYPARISFIDYKEIKRLPFFNLGPNKSGFHEEEFNECKKPFGSLAARTIGDLYPGKDSARSGLQLAYDTLLRGKDGIVHKQKVRNRYLPIVDVPPVDGADIKTTIDVRMQDFCEKAIVDKMKEKEVNGDVGIVILMEVKTGDVKAIVNMTRCEDGEYREIRNNAVSNMMEPGSVFKPMSFMVAFEDGKIHMNDRVDVAPGVRMMYGRKMKDHNWRRGGYQVLTVPECLEYSSNVGVSVLIDRYYHNCPERFVDGLYKIGVPENLHLDIPGAATPQIRRPKKDGSNWSKTALAWMSIGYETQVPPISVLNFYNGVANNGRMMRPRFVTAAMRDGEVIQEYPPQVIREHMCSPATLKNIQTCLRWVVSKGLGKKAGSPLFSVSGKTGTAQVWGKGGFSMNYLVSFAGYYPSEDPKYSCIVCIQKHGLPASGGGQCGPVFKKIAEMVMSEHAKASLADAVDTLHTLMPLVDYGNLLYANKVLEDMNLSSGMNWAETEAGKTIWGRAVTTNRSVQLQAMKFAPGRVPDVRGMGARDALYLLEKFGMRVKMLGVGIVTDQNLPAGHFIQRGELITLRLAMTGTDASDQLPTMGAPASAEGEAAAAEGEAATAEGTAAQPSASGEGGAEKARTPGVHASEKTSENQGSASSARTSGKASAAAEKSSSKSGRSSSKSDKASSKTGSSSSKSDKASSKTGSSSSKSDKTSSKTGSSSSKTDKSSSKLDNSTSKSGKSSSNTGRASSKSGSGSARSGSSSSKQKKTARAGGEKSGKLYKWSKASRYSGAIYS